MELLLIWIPASIAIGVYAARKGRSGFGVFLLSVLLSPIVGLLVAVAMKDKVAERRHQELVAAISGKPIELPADHHRKGWTAIAVIAGVLMTVWLVSHTSSSVERTAPTPAVQGF